MSNCVEDAYRKLPLFLSVGEVSEFLGISRKKVRELCEKGWLKFYEVPCGANITYRINKDSLGAMVGVEADVDGR